MNGTRYGKSHTLEFILIGNTVRRKVIPPENSKPFIVSLTSNLDFFGMHDYSADVIHELKPGYLTNIEVQAMEIRPSLNLRDIPFDRRGCRFEDEVDGLEIFQKYSQSACEFEFRIKSGEQFCRCVPWYIPSKNLKVILKSTN